MTWSIDNFKKNTEKKPTVLYNCNISVEKIEKLLF